MKPPALVSPQVSPQAIAAGIGLLDREALCALIALVESVDTLGLARAAGEDVARRLRLLRSQGGSELEVAAERLRASDAPDAVLRHRLWHHLSLGLALDPCTPLSWQSLRRASSALAVRTSERLSPGLHRRRRKDGEITASRGSRTWLKDSASAVARNARTLISSEAPAPFPEIVTEEFLDLVDSDEMFGALAERADEATSQALAAARAKTHVALAGGAGWGAFAAAVGSSGFAPYMLAAQASAWIPLVSGPGLVSLLAVLVNPVTLLVGLGGLAWLGVGRSTSAARSHVAARLCVLLAMRGLEKPDIGAEIFLGDMRDVARRHLGRLDHLGDMDRRAVRVRVTRVEALLEGPMPKPAGVPPSPWDETMGAARDKPDVVDVADGLAIASLTAGDMLWHAAAIDRNVLSAADFSRALDLGDPLSFAAHAHAFASDASQIALRGFAAERLVMDRLIAEGHDVVLPAASNMAGFDLLVDGSAVQVKCGESLSLLAEHFETYPDIPVIANAELAEKAWRAGAEWADRVNTLPGFDLEVVETQVSKALHHASELIDLDVLVFAFAVGLVRGGIEVWRGSIPVEDLPAWMLIDGAARGALGLAGAKGGAALGLLAIGPAGAVILGPACACAALMGTGVVRDGITRGLMRDWHRELRAQAHELHQALQVALDRRARRLAERWRGFSEIALPEAEGLDDWMRRKACDDVIAIVEEAAEAATPPKTEREILALLVEANRLAPTDGGVLEARAKLERQLSRRPSLSQAVFRMPFRSAVSREEVDVEAGLAERG